MLFIAFPLMVRTGVSQSSVCIRRFSQIWKGWQHLRINETGRFVTQCSIFCDTSMSCLLTRNRLLQYPLLYADLLDYFKLGSFEHLPDWDNADWGGWQEPPESPAHTSLEACGTVCHDHPECFSYTYHSSGNCFFTRTMRLGTKKTSVDSEVRMTAGWDLAKMQSWRVNHQCEKPQWVKPSITRIF